MWRMLAVLRESNTPKTVTVQSHCGNGTKELAFLLAFLCRKGYGGEGGIRTHGTVSRTLAFEASTFNRSVTSPRLFPIVTDGLLLRQCTLTFRSVWRPLRKIR